MTPETRRCELKGKGCNSREIRLSMSTSD